VHNHTMIWKFLKVLHIIRSEKVKSRMLYVLLEDSKLKWKIYSYQI
jgi:hypothetical protein